MELSSYPKVYAIGHRNIKGITDSEVLIEEKIDGSQFSFAVLNGELHCRSKGAIIYPDAPEKMFVKAIQTAVGLKPQLTEGCVYRCEYLEKPKHNALAYDRVPNRNLILFDIMFGPEDYMAYEDKAVIAQRLGLEVVPCLFQGKVDTINDLTVLLEKTSILGGQKIEGFVIKNYNLFTDDKKFACGKFVSEAFKEVHGKEWKGANPCGKDFVQQIIDQYRSESRWQKAIQHLREDGRLDGSPKDIGALISLAKQDTKEECADVIKEKLFEHFWKQIERGITAGLPEWYKEQLMASEFEEIPSNTQYTPTATQPGSSTPCSG